jgi:hypothetical protein
VTASESRSRGLGDGVGGEDRPDQRAEQAMLVLAGMTETVAEEVDRAALPGALADRGDRGLQTGVRVRDGELDTHQTALDQPAQEARPEGLSFGLADVDGQDRAPAGLVHAVREH